jgi:acetoacetyl-[acyl-carrier protein] synthase
MPYNMAYLPIKYPPPCHTMISILMEYSFMTSLPVIVGFGGVGAAGRSSFHHAYNRTIFDTLNEKSKEKTIASLASMMGLAYTKDHVLVDRLGEPLSKEDCLSLERKVLDGSLIRRLENNIFDPNQVHGHVNLDIRNNSKVKTQISILAADIPNPLPYGWEVLSSENGIASIQIGDGGTLHASTTRKLAVQSAGQLPTGFNPAALYSSRFHPRGLQLAIIGASDAVKSIGIPWQVITDSVYADEIAVYASSAMSQLDKDGTGGMLQARLRGSRVSSKQLPLGLNTMPADFINAYVLGSIGATGAHVGACASFLYNLRAAVEDIQSGRRKVVVVGNAEAPLVPEAIEGYMAMSALATDDNLCRLDGVTTPDYRRASRPFGDNCGFTLGESGQYFVLMEDSLAIELGAQVYGAVTDVFVNADGFKKSISAPGPGNYITLGKAVSAAVSLLGRKAVQENSFVQAHGSSTPQNRTTETQVLDKVAEAFGITDWPVTAIKAFVGHSLAPASADQLVSSLGVLSHGVLPGIKTIEKLAADLYDDRLAIALKDTDLGSELEVAFLNSKGFGGNNATGVVLSPRRTNEMLAKRFGEKKMNQYFSKREQTNSLAQDYDDQCLAADMVPVYKFGNNLIDADEIVFSDELITVPGFKKGISLKRENIYKDMT